MASLELPTSDSPDLRLVVGTAEECLAQAQANSTEWRGALSLPAYLRREDHLMQQVLTKDGGLTPWMLVHQPSGTSDADRRVICGCESIKKKALVAQDGNVKEVVAHGIASVFCPPHFRGRGYAGRMMADLGKKLGGWQGGDQDVGFSVLYSDIGKKFYAARGWKAFPSAHIALNASTKAPSDLPTASPLKAADLPQLCEADSQLLHGRLGKTSKPSVALVPDVHTLNWHHAREEFIADELYSRTADIKGAIVGTEPGRRAWCIWARVWTNPNEEAANTLHILRLVAEDEAFSDFEPASGEVPSDANSAAVVGQVAALLAAAQAEAEKWHMEHVEVWNPANVTLAAARMLDASSEVVHRESASIASLRWYGEGDGTNLSWVCNEKYGWC